jgi:hypothetical protein
MKTTTKKKANRRSTKTKEFPEAVKIRLKQLMEVAKLHGELMELNLIRRELVRRMLVLLVERDRARELLEVALKEGALNKEWRQAAVKEVGE